LTEEIYDVVVLGGGAGGVPAAIRAAQLGGRVAIIEGRELGGLCMNRACIPFGHMSVASDILGSLSLGKEMGLDCKDTSNNYSTLLKRQNELIEFMRMGIMSMLKKKGVEIIEGQGKIAEKGKVSVNGNTVAFKKLILATGATWAKPDFPGADSGEVMNSDDLLKSEKPPERILLFGKRPWIFQIAQCLQRFGSRVILVTEDKRILSEESKTVASRLSKGLKDEGIVIKTHSEILDAAKKNDGLHVKLKTKDDPETVIVDRLLSVERQASLKDLGLENIDLDEKEAYLKVNDRMETEAPGVYAIGDLTGRQSRHYSHLASEGGIIAAENAMGHEAALNPRTFTRVVFTQPQVACAGLTRKEAIKAGYEVVVGSAPLSMNPFGMILAENEGIVEVVADKSYGEILGVHMIGTGASEMIGQALMAIQLEATLDDLASMSFPHPTLSESLAEAAREALGRPIYIP
jgi:dihydrolipoamide dehydrogenase